MPTLLLCPSVRAFFCVSFGGGEQALICRFFSLMPPMLFHPPPPRGEAACALLFIPLVWLYPAVLPLAPRSWMLAHHCRFFFSYSTREVFGSTRPCPPMAWFIGAATFHFLCVPGLWVRVFLFGKAEIPLFFQFCTPKRRLRPQCH